jgi:hypothetical protein
MEYQGWIGAIVTRVQRKGYLNDLTCGGGYASLRQADVMLHTSPSESRSAACQAALSALLPASTPPFRPLVRRRAIQWQHNSGASPSAVNAGVGLVDQRLTAGFDAEIQLFQGPAANDQYDPGPVQRA